jgi:hypothetical protein
MKVYLSPWIKKVSGYLDGLVFYTYPEMPGVCYVRNYVKPPLTAHNHFCGECFKAIIKNVWQTASPGFKQDLKDYTKAWNNTQCPQKKDKHQYNAVNILIKACFNIAQQNDFDLRTLNISNFSGSETALLGNQKSSVANLIKTANLPGCGIHIEDFNSKV